MILEKYHAISVLCGSKVTCEPPPPDGDTDILIYVKDNLYAMMVELEKDGWTYAGGRGYPGQEFHVMKKDDVDYIMTDKWEMFKRHQVATSVCQKLNLLNKADRITVFRAILYNEEAPL